MSETRGWKNAFRGMELTGSILESVTGKSRQKVVGNLDGHPADIYTPSVSKIVGRYVEAVAGMKSIVPTWLSVFHAWQDRARG